MHPTTRLLLCCFFQWVSAQLIDPRTVYSNNYTLPDQDFPGLQSNWDPPIDSGETSYNGSDRLQGRRALITGGDSGIGRAVAVAFAREGADVAIGYLPEERSDAEVVRDLIEDAGRQAVLLPGDVRNETFCQELVDQAVDQLGGLDILVNNAGFGQNQDAFIGNTTTEIFDRTFQTNVYGAYWITRAASQYLPPGSSIIFTSSSVALLGGEDALDYSATKAVYVVWTRLLARQLAGRGIRVNAVAPGYLYTNFPTSQGDTTETARGIGVENPTGRNGQPAEMAPLYVTLADARNSFVSGSVWGANGGTGEY